MNRRLSLLLIWLSGYLICLTFLFVFLAKGWMLTDNFKKDFTTATGIFAPYLTPIVAFWFARRRKSVATADVSAFYVAVALSLVFNLLVLTVVGYTFVETGEGVIENNLELATTIGTGITFLTGPAVGYYFGKAS